jgi:ABC-type antimicrobial peptide transport system permease subunit
MVLSSTTGTLAAGLGVGVLLSIGLDKIASQWVTESSRDPIILASVTAVLLAVAALACLAPARRAASIDPMAAVRHE